VLSEPLPDPELHHGSHGSLPLLLKAWRCDPADCDRRMGDCISMSFCCSLSGIRLPTAKVAINENAAICRAFRFMMRDQMRTVVTQ